jgi:hypothetical protein
MPIPIQHLEEVIPARRSHLRLVGSADVTQVATKPRSFLYPRTLACCIDLFVVQGFSLYSAKLSTLALLSGHMNDIKDSGKLAGGIFRELFAFGNSQIFFACFAAFAFVYFIGMPFLCGRTFGLGVFGLKIANEENENPDIGALALRLVGLLGSFATMGLIFTVGLRRRDGRFLHDQWSKTKIVKA